MELYHSCIYIILSILLVKDSECLTRCHKCRSRGDLGTCGDPFGTNLTHPGNKIDTCQSGWCAKMLQGSTGTFRADDFGVVTQRTCLKEGPSDGEERCGEALVGSKKVFMCFCQGDLCNSAFKIPSLTFATLLTIAGTAYYIGSSQ